MCIRDRYQRRVRELQQPDMSSPGGASPRTPSALRNELAAAKRAVEVLKAEKQNSDEKLDKLHAVLEKERNALRDVLQAAKVKVDELEKVKREQADEIERLKRLLAERQVGPDLSGEVSRLKIQITQFEGDLAASQSTVSDRDRTIVDLRSQLQSLQAAGGDQASTLSAKDRMIGDLREQLAELQRQLASARSESSGSRSDNGETERLQKRIDDLTSSLQNTQKTMRDQAEMARSREGDLREQLNKQGLELRKRISELEAELRQAKDASKAHVLERLQREVLKYRQLGALRIMNSMLRKHHETMGACMFHQWVAVTDCSLLHRMLSSECEYKLNRLRQELTPGLSGPFGHTPLLHTTHLATRSLGSPQRFDKWEQMSPRSCMGDGASTISPRSRGTGAGGPVGRSLANDQEF
eukprot:TRINITY_DN26358_c0_g1_i2.p1 TRINITY_DN26358_c0_g1~~TRINITY_DN26358_c0_g1_i2.p1  ORF type:complete len:412 (+),score=136.56 TRINITY_DN26358_c0_g1_i2:136-1371(+)